LIDSILFDLDDTLIDTAAALAPRANHEAARAMVQAGLEAPLEVVERVRAGLERRGGLGTVDERTARAFGGGTEEAAAGQRAYFDRAASLRRGDVELMPGVRAMLARLGRAHELLLVTWGDPVTQARKVELLRLGSRFAEVVYVDRRAHADKFGPMQALLRRRRLAPAAVLVVGDSWEREILAGHQLGARTCWIRRGSRRPWPPLRPDAEIGNVCDVERVLARMQSFSATA
jgi:HAD superfamily hydrolase (TIGR01509 family)